MAQSCRAFESWIPPRGSRRKAKGEKPKLMSPTGRGWITVATVAAALLVVGCQEKPASDRSVTIDLSADIEALGSDDLFVSEPALDRITAIGEPAVPVLARVLSGERPAVRSGIIEALKTIGGTEATDALLAAARDPDSTVRYDALLVLGDLGDARARAPVEAALTDTEPRVRLAAAAACASLCESESALVRLVDLAVHDESFAIAIAARNSLIAIVEDTSHARAPKARALIGKRAESSMNGEAALEQRVRAALLVADLGDAAAAPILLEAVTEIDDAHLRPRAVFALGDVGGAESVAAVAAVLEGGPFACYGYDALRRMAARGVHGAQSVLDRYDGRCPPGPLPRP